MGKTKTAFVGGVTEPEQSGKSAYEEKRRKQAEKLRAEDEKQKAQVKGVGLKGGERIKIVGGEIPTQTIVEEPSVSEKTPSKKERKTKTRGKTYKSMRAKTDRNKLYSPKEAIALVKKVTYSKFDGTMELHLSVKSAKINLNVELPLSSGKSKKVEFADEKTIEKLKKGKIDFDVLLATSEMMPKLVPFAKLLGPRGLMPNPKNGTLVKSAGDAKKFGANTLVIKTEKDQPVVHTIAGKVSQKDSELAENISAIINAIGGAKQITKAYLKSTMSPSVKFQV